jgi:gamma-glutamyltranspeptidase/glutathione hydrolase
LAETFKIIGSQGPDAFYTGDIAKGIIEGQKRYRTGGKPGTMTETDLENYEPAIRVPVEASYRGYIIKSMPSPSSGGLTILQMLKMLERFTIGDASKGFGFGETNTLHVMIEAMRLAYADRAIWMGDADFAYVPAKGLLNPNYVALRGANIKLNSRITPNPTAGDPRPYDVAALSPSTMLAVADPVTGPGETTTHFSVVDKKGNFVSYTNTIESSHGIGVFAGYTDSSGQFKNFGFLLNNELTDFNTTPSINPYTGTFGTNDVEPGKRPRSSMAPSMIFDPKGNPIVAFGSPGGATIINSVFQVTMNLIDHGMSIQDAINAPRISVTAASGGTSMEPGFSQETIDALRTLGHSISVATTADIGSIQAVLVDLQTGKQYGGADSRREGTVIGLPRPQGKK